jgi:hypothetical protein
VKEFMDYVISNITLNNHLDNNDYVGRLIYRFRKAGFNVNYLDSLAKENENIIQIKKIIENDLDLLKFSIANYKFVLQNYKTRVSLLTDQTISTETDVNLNKIRKFCNFFNIESDLVNTTLAQYIVNPITDKLFGNNDMGVNIYQIYLNYIYLFNRKTDFIKETIIENITMPDPYIIQWVKYILDTIGIDCYKLLSTVIESKLLKNKVAEITNKILTEDTKTRLESKILYLSNIKLKKESDFKLKLAYLNRILMTILYIKIESNDNNRLNYKILAHLHTGNNKIFDINSSLIDVYAYDENTCELDEDEDIYIPWSIKLFISDDTLCSCKCKNKYTKNIKYTKCLKCIIGK